MWSLNFGTCSGESCLGFATNLIIYSLSLNFIGLVLGVVSLVIHEKPILVALLGVAGNLWPGASLLGSFIS